MEPTQGGYWATAEEASPPASAGDDAGIDPYVAWILRGTCGNLFKGVRLSRYPIPAFPPSGSGRMLEIGSNWGRWAIAAARSGLQATAVDPSLGAMLAGRRVAAQLGASVDFLVADGRHLPFADGSFDVVFSYSVLQHLGEPDVEEVLLETSRVLRPGGVSLHQIPNRAGLLNLYRQARRGFRTPSGFEVRYWRTGRLRRLFETTVGATEIGVDGFFTLNPHPGDSDRLPTASRALVHTSRALTRAVGGTKAGTAFADSLWVRSTKAGDPRV